MNLNNQDHSENWPPASSAIDLDAFKELMRRPELQNGPGSITWRVNGEIALALGWGRAILMQVAHPLVARGVAEHSHFSRSALAKMRRFKSTLDRMLYMTFGTVEEAWAAGRHIDSIHARVNGPAANGQPRYTARDSQLLKWVHATFVDSMFKTYELFVGPLSPQEKDDYLRQASIAGPLVGAPPGYFPGNRQELEEYLAEMLAGDTLQITSEAKRLAGYVLEGLPIPIFGPLLNRYSRLVVAATLPDTLRQAYGLKISRAGRQFLKATAGLNRRVRPWLPVRLKRWPLARRAERAAGFSQKSGSTLTQMSSPSSRTS